MAQLMTINLNKGDSPNLGFRLQGGVDFAAPLVIQKVNGGSPADRSGLQAGDAVIKINNTDVYSLRHKDAQDVIINAGPSFTITVQRGGSTWKPSVTPVGSVGGGGAINNVSPVTKTSLAAKPQPSVGAIGTGHNVSAKPFLNGTANGGPKLVNKQYNSPIGIYSEQSIAETLSAQSEVLSTGVLGVNFKKNEKNYDATKSAVYHMLQEAEREPRDSEPDQVDFGVSNSPSVGGQSGLKHVQAPENKPAPPPPSNPQLPPGQNICADCERLIVGVFVRIKDKNLHVECFKCSTCGASLKNVGYYNINNKLYCDIHAKLAAKSNAPAPNLVPVTVPPGGRAPAGAISAALASHSLPSPGPLSPKIAPLSPKTGPVSPSANITATPFQFIAHERSNGTNELDPLLLKNLTLAAAKKSNASFDDLTVINGEEYNPKGENGALRLSRVSYREFTNKANFSSAPRPFSSVTAPLSPNTYSRPLPKTPVGPPPPVVQATAPAPAPVLPPAPAPATTPEHETETEIVCTNGRVEITTKRIDVNSPTNEGYNQINVTIPLPTFSPSFSSDASSTSSRGSNGDPPRMLTNNYITRSNNNYLETTFPTREEAGEISTKETQTVAKLSADVLDSNTQADMPYTCFCCRRDFRGPFITALGKIWCPDHFVCATTSCRRPLQDIGFVEERGQLHCEYCFERYLAPDCAKCAAKIKGDCLKAIGKNFHPECFACAYCNKLFGNSPFFLEDGLPYCEADWNEMFTTKCFACGFPVEAGDRWVEALNNNYHSQCFNCTMCKKNLEGQSFFAKGGRPFCKNHAR